MESGPPITWRDLLAAFKDEEPELAIREVEKVSEAEYPDYAQEIFEALRGEGKEDRYYEILNKTLEAKNSPYSTEEHEIVKTAKRAVTTNFDDSFERGLRELLEERTYNFNVQDLPELQIGALSTEYSVSYLHGRMKERCIIFKKDDYETFYPSQSENGRGNDNLELFLRHMYEECTIVFIGVSFNDKYLLKALSKLCDRVKQNDEVGREKKDSYKPKLGNIQHYALMLEDIGIEAERRRSQRDDNIGEQQIEVERKRRIEQLAELRIKVVSYRNHKDWIDWFTVIRERRRGTRSALDYNKDPSKVVER